MQDIKLRAAEKRGIHQLGGDELVGWDEVTDGVVLAAFEGVFTCMLFHWLRAGKARHTYVSKLWYTETAYVTAGGHVCTTLGIQKINSVCQPEYLPLRRSPIKFVACRLVRTCS